MIKVEHIETLGFEHAIRNMKAKGYRKTRIGYETFVSDKSKSINLGTYKTEEEAKQAVYNYRIERFINKSKELGLNPYNGIEHCKNYIVFPSGRILNLHGKEMIGSIDKCGYRHITLNKKNKNIHRIIAKVFIDNPDNLEQVNHIDGNKLNNDVSNLEWCTRSDNLKHAYRIGLENKYQGEDHHSHKLTNDIAKYIREKAIKGDREYGFAALGRKLGVDKSTVSAVYYNETWRNVL